MATDSDWRTPYGIGFDHGFNGIRQRADWRHNPEYVLGWNAGADVASAMARESDSEKREK